MGAGRHESLRLAIVGATGVVGGRLLELIHERAFPCSELKLLSSEEHSGGSLESGGETRPVLPLRDASDLSDVDIVFLAVRRADAESILAATATAAAGPIMVDLSAASLLPIDTPLVAPGFTLREQVRDLSLGRVFHTPHPAAVALATILDALGQSPFCSATVILSASSSGHGAISHLVEQSADLLNGRLDLEEDEFQAAFNLAPPGGAPELERALVSQVARLTGRTPQLALQAVQVPVLHGTAISIILPDAAGSDAWAGLLKAAPGVLLVDSSEPLSVVDAIGQEALLLNLASSAAGHSLWCVFDNARRAALGALWIAECLVPDSGTKLN
jgi:aspartate-semialdehyde dehydrogenase